MWMRTRGRGECRGLCLLGHRAETPNRTLGQFQRTRLARQAFQRPQSRPVGRRQAKPIVRCGYFSVPAGWIHNVPALPKSPSYPCQTGPLSCVKPSLKRVRRSLYPQGDPVVYQIIDSPASFLRISPRGANKKYCGDKIEKTCVCGLGWYTTERLRVVLNSG